MSEIDEDDFIPPKTPFDYISRDQLQDMWGAGFTVIRQEIFGRDIFELADRVKRPGMARQWADKHDVKKFLADGWSIVNCEEYPGLFAPYGYEGPVEIGLLALVECPQHKVDRAKQAAEAQAHKLVDDWQEKYGGFSGEVTIGRQTELGKLDGAKTITMGLPAYGTIKDAVPIPRELTPYVAQIFEERDRIMNEDWRPGTANSDINAIAIMNDAKGTAMLLAIDNIRKRIAEEAASGKAS